ncbi:ammonium transporter 1 [Sodiomyces alkalinus F11]|uniref:Ammonium transporter n=1 Tax=Sodiomyces alkalinus (strain CBS 110278 / VKM F-3762 / F11) TaxID=1314773 RepID=A0A3N2PJ88_SODAK|nr:ammonium transporter 1 [Sodiomyces alkalinus F11]ROT34500.1 ammonium transporter 1 [Sodiomyces alkalinus F11]
MNEQFDKGDIAWMCVSAALVMLMIPGVGFFYAGLARRKSALSLMVIIMLAHAVATVQWWFWGYSLTFSATGSAFIGNLDNIGFRNVGGADADGIPEILFATYQGLFAAITPALALGAVADRGRILPALVFVFIWSTLVYDPIACWTWGANGWLHAIGSIDFAGGTPVHINSGVTALAYSLMIGKRTGYERLNGLPYRPHNVTNVMLGTVFLWVGWFGFNGGSTLAANVLTAQVLFITNLTACLSGLTWVLLDYRLEGKWSTIGFCSGAITGLVAITPAAGFVPIWSCAVFGIVGGVAGNFATKLKFLVGIDEALDVFAVHGVGGIVGNLLAGIFAASWEANLDGGSEIDGGWIEGHFVQLGYQLAGTVAGVAWSFVMTCLILFVLNLIPGLSLRVSPEEEELGLDDVQCGEFAYDYVEVRRHVSDVITGEEPARVSRAASAHSTEPEKAAPATTTA